MGNQMGLLSVLGHCKEMTSVEHFMSQVSATLDAITMRNTYRTTWPPTVGYRQCSLHGDRLHWLVPRGSLATCYWALLSCLPRSTLLFLIQFPQAQSPHFRFYFLNSKSFSTHLSPTSARSDDSVPLACCIVFYS